MELITGYSAGEVIRWLRCQTTFKPILFPKLFQTNHNFETFSKN